jgi:hypothetical protein
MAMTKRLLTKNNLQILLSSKFYTIKELHIEVILIMCHSLIASYLFEENSKDKNDTIDIITPEENKIINSLMEVMFKYLNENIISYPKIQEILNNAERSKENTMKARIVEPYAYFYNILTNAFVSRLNYVTQLDEKQQYIPDFLVINLLLAAKEKIGENYFKKFEFINSLDFNEVLEIYKNVQLKENNYMI